MPTCAACNAYLPGGWHSPLCAGCEAPPAAPTPGSVVGLINNARQMARAAHRLILFPKGDSDNISAYLDRAEALLAEAAERLAGGEG